MPPTPPGAKESPMPREIIAAHLTTALMDELLLIPGTISGKGGAPTPARLTAGVVQFLNADLKPADQAMLPEGLAITSYAPSASGGGFALAGAAQRVFRFEASDGALPNVTGSWRLHTKAQGLQSDPVLGLLMTTPTGLSALSEGADPVLAEDGFLQPSTGRESRPRANRFDRLLSADLTGDGQEELIVSDDEKHTLSVYGADMKPWCAWPVFTDTKYPYGGDERQSRGPREPRQIMGADLDGDGVQDLILSSQDRFVIYLGKDPMKGTKK